MLFRNPCLVVVLALSASACTGLGASDTEQDPMRYGLAVSMIPNLGVEAVVEVPLGQRGAVEWSTDWHATYQFIDDETFADDGNPSAGSWLQAGVALRGRIASSSQRDWTFRVGPEWFEARGEPNIVNDPGHYAGVRFGVGFETRVGSMVVGPELSVLWVQRAGQAEFVPQLVWGVRWSPR